MRPGRHAGCAGRYYPGHGPDFGQQLPVETHCPLGRFETVGRDAGAHDEHVLGTESQRHIVQGGEALHEESRTGQQHHREGDFGDHQGGANAARRTAHGTIGALFQGVVEIHAGGLQRRGEAEQEARQNRDDEGERQHSGIDRGLLEPRDVGGSEGHQGARAPHRQESGRPRRKRLPAAGFRRSAGARCVRAMRRSPRGWRSRATARWLSPAAGWPRWSRRSAGPAPPRPAAGKRSRANCRPWCRASGRPKRSCRHYQPGRPVPDGCRWPTFPPAPALR